MLLRILFADLDPPHSRFIGFGRGDWRHFPQRIKLIAHHHVMDVAQVGAGHRRERMGIVEMDFRFALIYFGANEPRIGDEPAAGGHPEHDALNHPGGF
jgi:hypothetical protein